MPHSSREAGVCRPHGPVVFSFFTLDLIGSKQLLMLSNCIFCAEQPFVILDFGACLLPSAAASFFLA